MWWLLIVYFGLQLAVVATILMLLSLDPTAELDDGEALASPGWLRWGLAISLVFSAVALVVLALTRGEFPAKVQRASFPKAIGVYVGLALAFIASGWALVELVPGTLGGGERLPYAAEKVLGGAMRIDPSRAGHAPAWVRLVLGLLGAIALFAGLFALFRSQRAAAVLHPADEVRIRELLARFGDRDSLGYFATRRDKAVIFAPSGEAAVAVRIAKAEELRASGVEPYPVGFARTDGCGDVAARLADLPPGTRTGERVAVAGRVMLLRNHGALCFATLRDWSGDVQVLLTVPAGLEVHRGHRRPRRRHGRGGHVPAGRGERVRR